MKTNTEFKNEALAALKGNWAPAVLCTLIYMIIMGVVLTPMQMHNALHPYTAIAGDPAQVFAWAMDMWKYSFGTTLLFILVFYPLEVGYMNAYRKLLHGDRDITENMFNITFKKYGKKVLTMFLMYLFVYLWSLLLIIPGIIKAFSYAMTPFIIEDNPELSANDAIDRSRAMMRGHKFDLFWLYLSFIGWYILCILTLGIGLLWLGPYVQTATAAFYEEVKAEYEEKAVA